MKRRQARKIYRLPLSEQVKRKPTTVADAHFIVARDRFRAWVGGMPRGVRRLCKLLAEGLPRLIADKATPPTLTTNRG